MSEPRTSPLPHTDPSHEPREPQQPRETANDPAEPASPTRQPQEETQQAQAQQPPSGAGQAQQPPYPTSQWGPPQGPPAGPTPAPSTTGSASRGSGFRGRVVVAAVLVAGLVGGASGAAGFYAFAPDDTTPVRSALDTPAQQTGNTRAPEGSVQAVAGQVLPSVVAITVSTRQGGGNGSGIILSSDGKILTNNHVAEAGAEGGRLHVTFANGRTTSASVVGLDSKTDIAVIQAEGVSGLEPAELGSSSALEVGQEVVAIGAPLGLDGTVTSGIVSALNRPVNTSDSSRGQSTVIDAVQTDAAINPGNSGGALVNMSGEVVGINSAIIAGAAAGNIGLGFAIPIDQARPIAEQLIETGEAEHALLGVRVGNAGGQDGTGAGAELGQITSGSAAAEAGLQEGDVVTRVDDRMITDANSLVAAVRSYRPGDRAELTYVRDGEEETVTVTLGSDG